MTSLRVGCKRAFTLFPRVVRDRMVEERLQKRWNPRHKAAVAEVSKRLEAMKEEAKGETLTGRKTKYFSCDNFIFTLQVARHVF